MKNNRALKKEVTMKVKAVAAAFALMGFGLSLVALCTSSGSIKHVNKARKNIPVITITSLERDFGLISLL